MRVECPKCAAGIPAADMDLTTRLAKCRGCDELFPFPTEAIDPTVLPPVPAGVEVTDDGVTRKLVFRWFGPRTVLTAVFCIAWDAFLIFWYTTAFARWPNVSWLVVVFPVGHVAIGVYMKYRTLAEVVNCTVVEVGDVLRVWHGPFFWPGGVELPAGEVTAVYCVAVATKTKSKKTVIVRYTVKASTEDGTEVTLLVGLDTLTRAKYFERKIEAWLGLSPTSVPEEAVG